MVTTADGSSTIFVPELGEHYHSMHGALQESLHVFIDSGWKYIVPGKIEVHILEAGMGTGLNAWLTLQEAEKRGVNVRYFAVEKYPLTPDEYAALNYVDEQDRDTFLSLHTARWEEWQEISPHFSLYKSVQDIRSIVPPGGMTFDLVYFDAFAPTVQEELWDQSVFAQIRKYCHPGAVLVTYSSKGAIRRNLEAAGWEVAKLPGPPGKREMVRAMAK